ncbi:hypothetical protein [Pseudonocardia sp. MH-G8]|uniref:hypothetical protein n=1 Tax=Pseudonocardia sp. MH-G8 TaxID=1854588 RepID=UPI00117B5EDC|nr:hypothetical protein [Pseudonocardia sp. MH-G8]
MSTGVGLLVFLGGPVLITGLITAVVFAVSKPREQGAPAGPPVGITAELLPCRLSADAEGRAVHEPDPDVADRRRCWRLACAECGSRYREGAADEVHFSEPAPVIAVARSRGWALAGHRMRCRRCR